MELTEAASTQVIKILSENDDAVALRIGIVAGGCSGYSYTFDLVEEINDNDVIISPGEDAVLVDAESYRLMKECTVDYEQSLLDSKFVIDNPDATGCCGCGKSFS